MSRRNKRRRSVGFIYGFAVTWLVMAAFLPMYKLWAVITALCASILVSSVIASASGKKAQAEEEKAAAEQREKEKQETERRPRQARATVRRSARYWPRATAPFPRWGGCTCR